MNIIQKKIKEMGLTAAQLAEKMGCSAPALSQVLNGNPTLTKLGEIAKAMDITVSELLREDQEDEGTAQATTSFVCPHCGKVIRIAIEKGDA